MRKPSRANVSGSLKSRLHSDRPHREWSSWMPCRIDGTPKVADDIWCAVERIVLSEPDVLLYRMAENIPP